jgi:hypothetical protein
MTHAAFAWGFHPAPYKIHEERYISGDDLPTKLVSDGGIESYDPPRPGRGRSSWLGDCLEICDGSAGLGRCYPSAPVPFKPPIATPTSCEVPRRCF